MRQRLKKWITLLVGWAFLLLGVLGLFLPILQGILFIVIGLLILSTEYIWAHHLLEKAKQRFPVIAHHAHHAREYAHGLAQRWHKSGAHPAAQPGDPRAGDENPRGGSPGS